MSWDGARGAAWVGSAEEFQTDLLALGPDQPERAAVLVQHPGLGPAGFSLGAALRAGLAGPTRSFTALVGYFHHGAPGPESDDPAHIVIEEGDEEAGRVLRDPDADIRFRLLVGTLSSTAAQLAAQAWYLLCRWRHETREGKAHTERLRAGFLAQCRERGHFAAACRWLREELAGDGAERLGVLRRAGSDLAAQTESALETYGEGLARALSTPGTQERAAAVLLGFFLQRRADFRIEGANTGGVFHPKIYVVERGDGRTGTTLAFVGSSNWSRAGLAGANVEVSTAHHARGHLWSAPEAAAPRSAATLTARVVASARAIFEAAHHLVGTWDEPGGRLPPVPSLEEIQTLVRPVPGPAAAATPRPSKPSEDFLRLVPTLRRLIRLSLGLPAGEEQFVRAAIEVFQKGVPSLFSGQRPARYQVDGALRLLGILEGAAGHEGAGVRRGAFLADEPGLGKTLISQMVAAVLLAARIVARARAGGNVPLRATFLVPRAIAGVGGDAPTGWHLRAEEVRRAVAHLLWKVHACSEVEARRLASEPERGGMLSLRVFSHGELAPQGLQPPEGNLAALFQMPTAWASAAAPPFVERFLHLALSEIVVIDEAHNFRNQAARATRTLRFLLSLPLPGEASWRIARPNGVEDPPAAPPSRDDSPFLVPRRKVLCVTATPFNNRLEDLLTEIGHFAQYQDWAAPLGAVGEDATCQLELFGETSFTPSTALAWAIDAWWAPSTPDAERRRAFLLLLAAVRRHLRSGRSLTVPPDQAREKAERNRPLRTRYVDFGPEYRWENSYANVEDAFAAALQWRRHTPDEDAASREQRNESQRQAAVQSLEAVLGRLFVIRSRVRVFRMAAEDEGGDGGRVLFRASRVPRHPLALNPTENAPDASGPGRAVHAFEAEVLGQLYEGLFSSSPESGLSFLAYELAVRRERDHDQRARNFVGFQRVGLIKRLQSSRYAFLRTLLRGIFRRSVGELAAVERLLFDELAGSAGDSSTARNLDRLLADLGASRAHLEDAIVEMGDSLTTLASRKGGGFLSLANGALPTHEDRAARRCLRVLCGAGAPAAAETEETAADASEEAPPGEAAFERIVEVLREGLRRWPRWIRALFGDALRGERGSRLYADARLVLEWVLRPDGLLHAVYGPLSRVAWPGLSTGGVVPMNRLVAALPGADLGDGPSTRAFGGWLLHSLETDHRAASLFGWLLLQRLADRATAEDADPPASGPRSLVFTEYTDTQDYLLLLLAGTARLLTTPSARAALAPMGIDARLLARLRESVREVASALLEQSQRVREALPAGEHVDPSAFAAPIDRDWWSRVERAGGPAGDALLVALDDLLAGLGRAASGDDRAKVTGWVADGTADAGVIDAFSPWYRIAPEPQAPPAQARTALERLRQAARRPCTVLVSTDVLAEGVNLQECGVVVHHDLPWNPTRLIQRNGRVDRRIDLRYEEAPRRDALVRALRERAGDAFPDDPVVPPFAAPRQVYHFTVVPVEPRLEGRARLRGDHVRRSLANKLEDIRALFGLTNWPVVLDHAGAAEVLSGEYDFETPGIRRREELFAALARLAKVDEAANVPPPGEERWLVVLPASFFRSILARRIGWEDAPASMPAPERIRAAGVFAGAPALLHRHPARPVRCSADASSAHGNALAGTLLHGQDDEARLLTWWRVAEVAGPGDGVSPGRAAATVSADRLAASWLVGAAPDRLAALQAEPRGRYFPLEEVAPAASPESAPPAFASPTDLADEILLALVDAGLRHHLRMCAHAPPPSADVAAPPRLLVDVAAAVHGAGPLHLLRRKAGETGARILPAPIRRANAAPLEALPAPSLWIVAGSRPAPRRTPHAGPRHLR